MDQKQNIKTLLRLAHHGQLIEYTHEVNRIIAQRNNRPAFLPIVPALDFDANILAETALRELDRVDHYILNFIQNVDASHYWKSLCDLPGHALAMEDIGYKMFSPVKPTVEGTYEIRYNRKIDIRAAERMSGKAMIMSIEGVLHVYMPDGNSGDLNGLPDTYDWRPV